MSIVFGILALFMIMMSIITASFAGTGMALTGGSLKEMIVIGLAVICSFGFHVASICFILLAMGVL